MVWGAQSVVVYWRAVRLGKHFTKVKHVPICVADGEIFHIPRSRRKRIEDFNTCREELSPEGFCGAFD